MTSRAMVIGGGIVGLTTGLALRKVGFEVTVCERARRCARPEPHWAVAQCAARVRDARSSADKPVCSSNRSRPNFL